jgi:lipopolysaccharide transport system ATP-binding protein
MMSDIAIRVENLGKMYRIGVADAQPRTAWQAVKNLVSAPFGYLQRMSRPPTVAETLWSLRDVSFEVRRGEVLGVIGRNGAGKSTLLKILARITEPTEGRAEIHGRVGSLLEVGTGFHPELTGRENIYLNGAILGMKRAEIDRRFDEIVAFAEIERFLDTPVKRYSSGMYVRLAFGVAAHLEPEILLVDEVLAVGDAAFQEKCLGKMSDVAREGRTILFVSHNMAAVQSLTSRTILLQTGAVAFAGTPIEAIQEYVVVTSGHAATPLNQRTDRAGAAPGTIQDVSLFINERPVGSTAVTGQPLDIHVGYHAESRGKLDFYLAFYDIFERRVVHVNSVMSGMPELSAPSHGTVACTIPKLPLAPGRYNLAVAVDCQGETLDRVEGVCQLTVTMGDFYGTGRTRGSDWGMVLIEHQWQALCVESGASRSPCSGGPT